MKQFTDTMQTSALILAGFPPPKGVSQLKLDWDMDTIPVYNYSIGELMEFLPNTNPDTDTGLFVSFSPLRQQWVVDYSTRYLFFQTHLIDALVNACISMKRDALI